MLTLDSGGTDMVMTLDYRGPLLVSGEPSADELDNLSLAIVEGLCDHYEVVEPGLVHLYIRE